MSWPLLDGPARRRLAGGALVGRTVRLDVPADEGSAPVTALLTASGARVVADASAELVVREHEVVGSGVTVDVPVLDPTGEAHATIRAVLRLTNRRLPGCRVAVVGFDPTRRELARAVRALGGRVAVIDDDPLRRLAALTDGHALGDLATAEVVFTADTCEPDAGAVVAGPRPAALGDVLGEPRPGMFEVRCAGRDLYVLDPAALAGGRAQAAVDLSWTTRLVTLAWLAGTVLAPGRHTLPVERRREIAASVLQTRGVAT